jgi:uncharacterized protein (AIM24 family)
MRSNHEIDYFIKGEEMQLIEIELDPQETAIAEAGAFMYMDQSIEMQTIFGDGTPQTGFMGKLFSAGKRLLTGESLFMTAFTNQGLGKARVAFASPYPGKIIAFDLLQYSGKIYVLLKALALVSNFKENLERAYSGAKVSLCKS